MKFALKITPEITEKVKKMTTRQLLQTVSCPAVVYTHGVTEYTHKAWMEKLFQ